MTENNIGKVKILYEDDRGNEMSETISVGQRENFDEGTSPWSRTVKNIVIEDK